jgi:ergothioneine biosynthesis protein EgtB
MTRENDTSPGERYGAIRQATEKLCAPLSPEDCALQSMEFASPAKWHLAHTSWFFETFLLEDLVPGYRHYHPQYRVLFNSYYETVGEQHPRPRRGFLSRPTLEEIHGYRRHVDGHVQALLEGDALQPPVPSARVLEVGLQHEQQHQELLLTDIKHLFSFNPLRPAYRDGGPVDAGPPDRPEWKTYDEGMCRLGHDDDGFAFDNEWPRHDTFVHGFELASRPVTNAEFVAFLQDGGYERPELWLSDGWSVVESRRWKAPLYWEKEEGEWFHLTLSGFRKVLPGEPVCHVSYYEADAFARWAGARLPTEAEWECAAADLPVEGNFVESGHLHPTPAPADGGAGRPAQMFGDVWEWTGSPYAPYPGFRPLPGSLGEYNGKFMCNQMVLRGGSCASPASHLRPTYRNFFYPDQRWQFSGFRLARDAR